MLNGLCDFAVPASLSSIYQVRSFTDSSNSKTYCLAMEVNDVTGPSGSADGKVDKGWGTLIVDENADREISHTAPHVLYDLTTESEAISIFKATNSRSYLLAGTHRAASSAPGCQADCCGYEITDVAHETRNFFHHATVAMDNYYGSSEWTHIQWHGMASDSCSANVMMATGYGTSVQAPASSRLAQLRSRMQFHNPSWVIEATGAGSCSMTGTTNVQGRFLNGVSEANACGSSAQQYTQTFIHIEQDPNNRNPSNWIQSILDVWGVGAPPAPASLSAAPGSGSASLSWPAAQGATSYAVFRSTTSGGSYAQIAATASTSYGDSGLSNGVTYYYVVQAINQFGNGGISPQAEATPQPGPAAPTGVTAIAGRRQVTVSWDAVTGAASYKLKRSTTNGGPYTVVASGITGTSLTNSGLTAGLTYYFVVSAVNSAGIEGSNSVQVSAVPKKN
jgi:hypothetical protein